MREIKYNVISTFEHRLQCKLQTLALSCHIPFITQQTRGIHPMLFQCWASVEDGVPALKQLWVNAPCLLGRMLSLRLVVFSKPWCFSSYDSLSLLIIIQKNLQSESVNIYVAKTKHLILNIVQQQTPKKSHI